MSGEPDWQDSTSGEQHPSTFRQQELDDRLYFAIWDRDVARVRHLVLEGANVNAAKPECLGMFGHTTGSPLHIAVVRGDVESVKELIGSGADVSAADSDGWTPLHWAAQQASRAISSARHDSKSWAAVSEAQMQIVRVLLQSGACTDCRDNEGRTPLAWAGEDQVNELLLESGARPDLATAARDGDVLSVCRLLSSGSDIEMRLNDKTPLHYATRRGNVEVVGLLLAGGADVNARTANTTECRGWYTPLHLAAKEGYCDIVELLLDHGADVNARDNYEGPPDWKGYTALRYAREGHHTRIEQLLMQRGGIV